VQLATLKKEVKGNSKDIENIFMVMKELIEKHSNPPPRNRTHGLEVTICDLQFS
jgi:hypothetical protein